MYDWGFLFFFFSACSELAEHEQTVFQAMSSLDAHTRGGPENKPELMSSWGDQHEKLFSGHEQHESQKYGVVFSSERMISYDYQVIWSEPGF